MYPDTIKFRSFYLCAWQSPKR